MGGLQNSSRSRFLCLDGRRMEDDDMIIQYLPPDQGLSVFSAVLSNDKMPSGWPGANCLRHPIHFPKVMNPSQRHTLVIIPTQYIRNREEISYIVSLGARYKHTVPDE